MIEGHNEDMFNNLLQRILGSNDYENFIHDNIYKALMKVFIPKFKKED